MRSTTAAAARSLRAARSIPAVPRPLGSARLQRPLAAGAAVRGLSLSAPRPTKIDPSLYVATKPSLLPGTPKPSGKTYSPAVQAVVKAIGAAVFRNKTSRAISNTRYILGFCSEGVERNEDFFWDECRLPPTFQSYFQVQCLIVMIHMVRLRALPEDVSMLYQKELLTHLFSLLETRMRRTLGNATPERMVKQYMRDFGEQYQGIRFSFDLGLGGTDADLAAYVWRNIFGGRGIEKGTYGIKVPEADISKRAVKSFAVGRPDGAGGVITEADLTPRIGGEGRVGPVPTTVDSPPMPSEIPADWNPLGMVDEISEIVGFVRRETARLETIPDQAIIDGFVGTVGPVRERHVAAWNAHMESEARRILDVKGADWLPSRTSLY